jgi:hypothetical protein
MRTIANSPVYSDQEARPERPAPLDFATWHARLRGHSDYDVPPTNLIRGNGRRTDASTAAPLVFDWRAA